MYLLFKFLRQGFRKVKKYIKSIFDQFLEESKIFIFFDFNPSTYLRFKVKVFLFLKKIILSFNSKKKEVLNKLVFETFADVEDSAIVNKY